MDNDRKTTALKQLQGHMWREAYKSGDVKGHIYNDVPKALESWAPTKKIYIYSSGSIEAQKLLFANSSHGDLLPHITDHFDTEIGPKHSSSSYKSIISKLSVLPTDVLFLTDTPTEAKAAVEAGLSSILIIRQGNAPLTVDEKSSYPTVHSFLDITFQTPLKRQKLEERSPPKDEENVSTEKKIDSDQKPDPEKPKETDPKGQADPEDVEMTDVSEKAPEAGGKIVETKSSAESDVSKVPVAKADDTQVPEKPTEESPEPAKPEKMEVDKSLTVSQPKDDKLSPEKLQELDSKSPVQPNLSDKLEEKPEESKTDGDVAKVDPDRTQKPERDVKKGETDDHKEVKAPDTMDEDKVLEKVVETVEKVQDKTEKPQEVPQEAKADDKEKSEEVKQNGQSKVEVSIEDTKLLKAEVNGKKDEDHVEGVKEPEKDVSKDVKDSQDPQVPQDISDKDVKDLEEVKDLEMDKSEEKKVNGNSETEDSHRTTNNSNETSKNGESSDDQDTIKTKKVVESIVDGTAPDADVVPVAVVAATS
ncbi:enolase-phosphatase E1 isoform X2 [Diachasmimorpha longicaudata]